MESIKIKYRSRPFSFEKVEAELIELPGVDSTYNFAHVKDGISHFVVNVETGLSISPDKWPSKSKAIKKAANEVKEKCAKFNITIDDQVEKMIEKTGKINNL